MMKPSGKVKSYQFPKKTPRRQLEDNELKLLRCQIQDFNSDGKLFNEFPVSNRTKKGLAECGYRIPTDIQSQSIGLSLLGHDILGAAKTGSGKTLAFIVPLLEKLFHEKWTALDGVGALVITPTRELAYQIFEVLRKVGRYHEYSAALVIGGKDLEFESSRLDRCNIIICTPGRLLQHLDENPLMSCDNLQMLVLDEADRILDMGFQETINAIVANLPTSRQTLLFSATQTKSVKDLARLSLSDPMYVSTHEKSEHATPDALRQSYVVCEQHQKITMLWSFVKSHLRSKTIVFLSSCKQVKFVYEAFCHMRPGLSVLALYGSMHQLKRMAVYDEFCRKQRALLLATDIAARGLDFPSVHWVLQFDCPEDVNSYIHRSGRTARYEKEGESLLVLLPSEEQAFLEQTKKKRIPIEKIEINPKKMTSVQRKLEGMLARDPNLKASAQRAFTAYIKSVYLMRDKSVFDVDKIDFDAFARSLGMVVTPRIRFLQKIKAQKTQSSDSAKASQSVLAVRSADSGSDLEGEKPERPAHYGEAFKFSLPEGEDIFTVKQRHLPTEETAQEICDDVVDKPMSKKQQKKLKERSTKEYMVNMALKGDLQLNQRLTFNDNDDLSTNPVEDDRYDLMKAKEEMRQRDLVDRRTHRDKMKSIRQKLKAKKKEKARGIRGSSDESESGSESDQDGLPKRKKSKKDLKLTKRMKSLQKPEDDYGGSDGSEQYDDVYLEEDEQMALSLLLK